MKKVLILAYDFPPYISVSGQRPYSWYKNLKKFGIHPIIITRQWGNLNGNHLDFIQPSKKEHTTFEKTDYGMIIRTPFRPNISNKIILKYGIQKFSKIRKFITLLYEFFQFLFPIGNKRNIYFEAKKYMSINEVDYIIATGEPFILFQYAHKLSKKFNISWAGDYRDPWVLNTFNLVNPLLKYWYTFHEKKLLLSMNLILTVSDFMAANFEKYNINNVPIKVITNGYDLENIKKLGDIKQKDDVFSIAYAGSIYPYHPYKVFFDTLLELKENYSKFNFQLTFYGTNKKNEISKDVKENYKPLEKNIKFVGKLPNNDLLEELSKANALLLFNEYSFMGTKIYDYLAVKRFVIHCFNNERDAKILKNNHFPVNDNENFSNKLQQDLIEHTYSGKSIENKKELKEILISLFNKFQKEKEINIKSKNINYFSRQAQSEKLAKIIQSKINTTEKMLNLE